MNMIIKVCGEGSAQECRSKVDCNARKPDKKDDQCNVSNLNKVIKVIKKIKVSMVSKMTKMSKMCLINDYRIG